MNAGLYQLIYQELWLLGDPNQILLVKDQPARPPVDVGRSLSLCL